MTWTIMMTQKELCIKPYGFLVDCDFNDTSDLWVNEMDDFQLLEIGNKLDKYVPIVEDISLDDEVLCSAVEQIESQ